MELYGSSYVKSYESTYKTKGAGVKIASSMDPAPIAPRNSNIFSEFQFGGMTLLSYDHYYKEINLSS